MAHTSSTFCRHTERTHHGLDTLVGRIGGRVKGGWDHLPEGRGHRPQCRAKGSQKAPWDTEPGEVLLPPSYSQTSRRHESAHLTERDDSSASRFSVFRTRLIILYSSGSQMLIEFAYNQNNDDCLPTTARLQLLCKVK